MAVAVRVETHRREGLLVEAHRHRPRGDGPRYRRPSDSFRQQLELRHQFVSPGEARSRDLRDVRGARIGDQRPATVR